MKNTSIYYFKIKSLEQTDPIMVSCSADILMAIENFEQKVAFKDDGANEILFTFLTIEESKKLVEIFTKYVILIKAVDITVHVLTSNVVNKQYDEIFDIREFKTLLDEFLLSNLTIDLVLEKISEFGIESLSDIDKSILEQK